MSKLKHFAHPRHWEKGEPMLECTSPSDAPAIMTQRHNHEGIVFLAFTSDHARRQWLKWWRK